MNKKIYITEEGFQKLEKELEYLKTVRRGEILERIKLAKEMGDLSENAEYAEAREAQSFNEGRILELEERIKQAVVVPKKKKGMVQVGSIVTVRSDEGKKRFEIVGFGETDPEKNKISSESPLGQAFLNHKKGDKIEVQVPSGIIKYKIIKVT